MAITLDGELAGGLAGQDEGFKMGMFCRCGRAGMVVVVVLVEGPNEVVEVIVINT